MTNKWPKGMPIDAHDFQKILKEWLPQINKTPSGYEIRAKLLEMAQTQVIQDYQFKVGEYEIKGKKDGEEYIVEFPGPERVVEIAEQFNKFVNNKSSKCKCDDCDCQ